MLAMSACKSGDDEKKKDVSLLPEGDDTAMLEEPVVRRATPAEGKEEQLFIPTAEQTMTLTIDGEMEDWRDLKLRTFEDREDLVDGRSAWKGKKDASMEIGAHADTNYFYVAVKVRDDKVLSQDAIHLWVRDPKLEQIMSSMPQGVSIEDDITHDLGLLITSEGDLSVLSPEDYSLHDGALTVATTRTSGGWSMEAAIAIEALPFVASLPLMEVAFRVDLHDSDKKSARSAQTIMSMLPHDRDDRPRFALIAPDDGLLPHMDARGVVMRTDGVGYWRAHEDHWKFNSLEALPKVWRALADTSTFLQGLEEPFSCPSRDQESVTLEAYRTRSERHRIGLVLCSAKTERGNCPRDASTQLFWVHQARDDNDQYDIRSSISVFDKPLPQCRTEAVRGELFRDHFATIPLDFVNANVWAVSWRERLEDSRYSYVRHVAQLLSAKTGALMGDVHPLLEREDDGRERVETVTMSYFIDVDDVEGLDICEVERLLEQDCESYQRGCKTRQRGSSVMTRIKLWTPETDQFERYSLRRHKGCPSKFDLSQREGYLLFHTGTRVGLLPSVLNKE